MLIIMRTGNASLGARKDDMKHFKLSTRSLLGATALAGCLAAAPAGAQVLGLGTTQGGATGQIGTALSQIISMNSDLQVIPQISANTSQYIPLVDGGQLELGIANYPQTYYAVKGTGMSTKPAENLELVATLMPFYAALVATEKSGIETYADIKGHTVPRYSEDSLGDFVVRALLAAGGLTYDDVTSVPIANFPQQYQAFKDGRIDVSIATVGSQASFDLEASAGDIQFLPVEEAALPAVRELMPGAYLHDVPANEELAGLDKPTRVMAYDYMLFTSSAVSDADIEAVAKAIYENADALKATSPVWDDFNAKDIGKKADIPYHPGAKAYYEANGLVQ